MEKPQKRRLADIRSAAVASVSQDLYGSTAMSDSPTSDDGSHTFYDVETHGAAAEETDSLYPNGER